MSSNDSNQNNSNDSLRNIVPAGFAVPETKPVEEQKKAEPSPEKSSVHGYFNQQKKHPNKIVYFVGAFVAILFGLYSLCWFYNAKFLRNETAKFLKSFNAEQGVQSINFSKLTVSGFPASYKITIEKPEAILDTSKILRAQILADTSIPMEKRAVIEGLESNLKDEVLVDGNIEIVVSPFASEVNAKLIGKTNVRSVVNAKEFNYFVETKLPISAKVSFSKSPFSSIFFGEDKDVTLADILDKANYFEVSISGLDSGVVSTNEQFFKFEDLKFTLTKSVNPMNNIFNVSLNFTKGLFAPVYSDYEVAFKSDNLVKEVLGADVYNSGLSRLGEISLNGSATVDSKFNDQGALEFFTVKSPGVTLRNDLLNASAKFDISTNSDNTNKVSYYNLVIDTAFKLTDKGYETYKLEVADQLKDKINQNRNMITDISGGLTAEEVSKIVPKFNELGEIKTNFNISASRSFDGKIFDADIKSIDFLSDNYGVKLSGNLKTNEETKKGALNIDLFNYKSVTNDLVEYSKRALSVLNRQLPDDGSLAETTSNFLLSISDDPVSAGQNIRVSINADNAAELKIGKMSLQEFLVAFTLNFQKYLPNKPQPASKI
jgi:hypothetical protein